MDHNLAPLSLLKLYPHQAAAPSSVAATDWIPLEYIMTLGNGGGGG